MCRNAGPESIGSSSPPRYSAAVLAGGCSTGLGGIAYVFSAAGKARRSERQHPLSSTRNAVHLRDSRANQKVIEVVKRIAPE